MLVGVRISAFVNVDDKTPLQKSIIGFLQPGKMDASDLPKAMHQQLEEKDHRSISNCPFTCLSTLQMCQRPEEVHGERKQRGSEGTKTGEKPQQSFFQRAHAKRLQLLAVNANMQQENSPVISSPVTSAQEGVAPSTEVNCTVSGQTENDCPVDPHVSMSGCGGLSCPVCFRRVETTDLSVFNRHIDKCLSDCSQKPNQSTKHREELESESAGPAREPHDLRNRSIQSALSINGSNTTVNTQTSQSCNDKRPILICPICQLTQDCDDLIIFNHHVDLCLNQEVLHELQGETSSPINPASLANSKALGECVH